MHLTPMRPTFEMEIPFSKEEVMCRVGAELQRPDRTIKSLLFKQYAELHIPDGEVRYWSPHLSLSFDEEGTHTRVRGRFAPRNEVWTLLWVVYLLLAFSAFFAAIFECASRMIGSSTWFGIAAILALVGIAVIYILSQVGQRLSTDQMLALKADWVHVLERAFPSFVPPRE